jgi:ABC-type phosphate/phosphonate transport system ATPase subunit
MDLEIFEKGKRQMELRIDSLSFNYPSGVEALREISLSMEWESLALVGRMGLAKLPWSTFRWLRVAKGRCG